MGFLRSNHSPDVRARADHRLRRLTLWISGAAGAAVAVLGFVAAASLPGTSDASAAGSSSPPQATDPGSTAPAPVAAATPAPAPPQIVAPVLPQDPGPSHAVTGASRHH